MPSSDPFHRTVAQLAADPFDRWRWEPRWVSERRRRDRADAIAVYHRHLAMRARMSRYQTLMAGYHLGPAPYGYLAQAAAPNGAARGAGGGRRRRRLVPDPATAHVVWLIFSWRVRDGLSCVEIARELVRHPLTWPGPVQLRTGTRHRWTAAKVRAILANPRYTGRQVTPLRPASTGADANWALGPRRWWASPPAHLALISDDMFRAAQHLAGPDAPLWLYGPPDSDTDTGAAGTGADVGVDCGTEGDDWPVSA